MSRPERKHSICGIYHIMLRGINRQQIFEDEEDIQKFLFILKDCRVISEFKIFAYCFMGNHLHLLLKEEKENLETIFKRIGVRYVCWYNSKYDRRGHLFQDRFKSEPINDDTYFLTVLRYIHQNPVKAKTGNIDYKYSSYNEYINPKKGQLATIDFVFDMMSKSQFICLNENEMEIKCLDIESDETSISDGSAQKAIFRVSHCSNVAEFQRLDINKRNNFIHELKKSGLSIRQISRLTGVSKGIVERN